MDAGAAVTCRPRGVRRAAARRRDRVRRRGLVGRAGAGAACAGRCMSTLRRSPGRSPRSGTARAGPAAACTRCGLDCRSRDVRLGQSSIYNQPVAGSCSHRAAGTARLAALALFVATIVGLPIGSSPARGRGVAGAIVEPISTALIACPPLMGGAGPALARGGDGLALDRAGPPAAAGDGARAAARGDARAAAVAGHGRRAGAVDLTAAARAAFRRWRRLWIHAVRQSLRPVLGVYGLVIGSLLSGSLAVEVVTSWPGLGRLTYGGASAAGLVPGRRLRALRRARSSLLGNLAADVLRAVADPRVREHA